MWPADLKTYLEEWLGISQTELHVYAGVLIYLVVLLVRADRRSLAPWLVVLTVAVANEGYDLWAQVKCDEEFPWTWSLQDMVHTMLLPTALLLTREPWSGEQRH